MSTPRRVLPRAQARLVQSMPLDGLQPDPKNPRKPDPARTGLLMLSLRKLGFIQPVFALRSNGLLLSGHQRTGAAKALGYKTAPVCYLDIPDHLIRGVNVMFNRATNDFAAFDTGSKAQGKLDLTSVIEAAEALPDFDGENWLANNCRVMPVQQFLGDISTRHDTKAVSVAAALAQQKIRIPAVVSESGHVVNGVYRILAAAESDTPTWPIITIPDAFAKVAVDFLNYLSMDYHVDDEFARLLRHSAYRRPQNNRGMVPKAMRFWANGEKTLPDADSYSPEYWTTFRQIHGNTILDFGAGLGKAAPFLRTKGIDAHDFEPFRINPDAEAQVPDPAYSRAKAEEFLQAIANRKLRFDSIFLCSVLNSVPFQRDRMCVLAIVHALSTLSTRVYGTCRDMSDFNYEYGGIRVANYFTFDSEPGVRLGDAMRNPKIQKFETQDTTRRMLASFWKDVQTYPGGNVHYWRAAAPVSFNPKVLKEALEFEFNLPYGDGSTMGLAEEAKRVFGRRLGVTL